MIYMTESYNLYTFFFNYFIFEIKDIIMNEESIIRTYEKNLVIKIWKKSFDFQTL